MDPSSHYSLYQLRIVTITYVIIVVSILYRFLYSFLTLPCLFVVHGYLIDRLSVVPQQHNFPLITITTLWHFVIGSEIPTFLVCSLGALFELFGMPNNADRFFFLPINVLAEVVHIMGVITILCNSLVNADDWFFEDSQEVFLLTSRLMMRQIDVSNLR